MGRRVEHMRARAAEAWQASHANRLGSGEQQSWQGSACGPFLAHRSLLGWQPLYIVCRSCMISMIKSACVTLHDPLTCRCMAWHGMAWFQNYCAQVLQSPVRCASCHGLPEYPCSMRVIASRFVSCIMAALRHQQCAHEHQRARQFGAPAIAHCCEV